MSLISTLAQGARASSSPPGFRGASVRAGAIVFAGLAVVATAGVSVAAGPGSLGFQGLAAAPKVSVSATAGSGALALAGRPAFPVIGFGANVGAGAGSILFEGLPVSTAYGQSAGAGAGGFVFQGLAAAPQVSVSATVGQGALALDGLQVAAGGAAGRVAGIGTLGLQGRQVAVSTGTSVSANPAAGALALDGKPVTAGASVHAAAGAATLNFAGEPVAAGGGATARAGAGELLLQGRGVSTNNGSAVSAAAGEGSLLFEGKPVTVAISVNLSVLVGSINFTGRAVSVSTSTAIEPDTADGLPILSLGLADLVGHGGENPWKNYRHLLNGVGGNIGAKIAADEWDPATGILYVPPNTSYTIDRVRPLAASPGNFDIDPGVWVLKCTLVANSGAGGTAPTTDINCGGFVNDGSAGLVIRKTADLTGVLNGNQVTLDGGANGGRIKIDFWGPEIYEGDPDGWHPNFLAYVRRYKVLRGLDYVDASGSKIVRDSQWVNDSDAIIHRSANGLPTVPPAAFAERERAGFSYGKFLNLCVAVSAAAHLNIPFALGCGSIETQIRGFTGANGPVTATQLTDAAAANGATILAEAEVEFLKHGQRIGQSAAAQNYPDSRALFLEIGNEQWNQATTAFKRGFLVCDGLGKHLTGVLNMGRGYGAICARAFKNLKKGILQYKPNQALVFVFGVQTAQPFGVGGTAFNRVTQEIDAFIAADAEAVPKIDIFPATTSYISGAHKWNQSRSPGLGNPWGATSEAAFDAAFAASHSSDPAAHRVTVKNWFIDPASTGDSTAAMIMRNIAYRDMAIAAGYGGILQYEGSCHDDPVVGTLPTTYPPVTAAIVEFLKSAEGYDVQLDAIDRLRAINPTNPAKLTGWRPSEIMISNYRDVTRRLDKNAPWNEREADEIVANLSTGFAGAWQARGRFQPAGLPALPGVGSLAFTGLPVTASAGAPASAVAGLGALALDGKPVTASAAASTLLASWNFSDFASLADLETAGWSFTGDWSLIDDNGSPALFGTTGTATPPSFRAAGTGNLHARVNCSFKTGDVAASSEILRFIDSTTGLYAAVRIDSAERVSVRRFNSATEILAATQTQSIGAYAGFGIGAVFDDFGFVRIIQNGADNGNFTGDIADSLPAGIDQIAFVAHSGGVHVRNSVEIFSNPTGGVSGAIAAANPAPGVLAFAGLPANASGNGVTLLASWSIDDYADIAAMEADGFVFSAGHDWSIGVEAGERVLSGTTGFFVTPLFRNAGSGALTARVAFDHRFGNVLAEATVMEFRDSTTGQGAQMRVNPADKLRLRKFGGLNTYLTATTTQSIGGFTETEASVFIADANGTASFKKNGVANGSFTGDTLETTPAGLDTLKFHGIPEVHSIRRRIDVWSNAAASPVAAAPGVGQMIFAGLPAVASVNVSRVAGAGALVFAGGQVGVHVAPRAGLGTLVFAGLPASASAGVLAAPEEGAIVFAGQPVTATIGFTYAALRIDLDGGIEANFPLRFSSNHVPLGASDPIFLHGQPDGGDIRAYLADGTAIAAEKVQWNKGSGVAEFIARPTVALARGDFIVWRSGGNGALSFPGDNDSLGMKAVYSGAGAVLVTHDWVKNSVTGGAFTLDALGSSPVVSAGPNGLLAMNFNRNVPPQNTLDAADIVMESPAAISLFMLVNPKSKGAIDNFGRFFQGGATSAELYFDGATGNILFEQEYSLADGTLQGEWTVPFATFSAWSGIWLTHTGEGNPSPLPHWAIDGTLQTVTEKKAPPANAALNETVTMSFFNHNPSAHNKPLDCEGSEGFFYDVVKSDAFMQALDAQFRNPASVAKIVLNANVIPSFVPSKELEAWLAAMSVEPSLAHKQDLDGLLIKPLYTAGIWQKGDLLYALALESAQAAGVNGINPSAYALSVLGAPTHTTNRGMSYDGVDDLHSTGWNFPGGAKAGQNSLTLALWSRTSGQVATGSMGARRNTGSVTSLLINPRTTSDLFAARANDDSTISAASTDGSGFFAISRTASGAQAIYKNGVSAGSDSNASLGLPDYALAIGGIGGNGATSPANAYGAREISFAFVGAGLNATENAALYDAVNDYLTARFAI